MTDDELSRSEAMSEIEYVAGCFPSAMDELASLTAKLAERDAEIERLREALKGAADLKELITALEHEHRQHPRLRLEHDIAEIQTNIVAALAAPSTRRTEHE